MAWQKIYTGVGLRMENREGKKKKNRKKKKKVRSLLQ